MVSKMKNFIRMNVDDNYLSLGNLFRIIKEKADTNNTFWQPTLFSIIFDTDDIADSTINNYCTGLRAINPKYKKYITNLKIKFEKNNEVLIPILSKILNLVKSENIVYENIEQINNCENLKKICQRLYYISKNDIGVDNNLSIELYKLLENNDLYNFFAIVLFYVVLDNKQPIFYNNVLNKIIEENIYDTNISMKDIQDFIAIQLSSWTYSMRTIKELVESKNPLACFEIGSLEYSGIITGKPRYEKAYEYYKIAADNNHPIANWVIGHLYYSGLIGNKEKRDMYLAIKYFNKSRKLNCSYSYNSFGLMYLNGNMKHIEKNKLKAIQYFEKAIELDNVYAYNNLGKIYENDGNTSKAYEYYKKAASLGESWALNKLGEFYRKGIAVKKDLKKAFEYYTKSSEATIYTLCHWSKYNLAKYYYKDGNLECGIEKDISKAIELLDEVSPYIIDAVEELIYIYYGLYLNNNNYYDLLQKYINLCQNHKDYNEEIGKRINNILLDIHDKKYKIILPK